MLERRVTRTGLGLVITRTIVERHNGTIALDGTAQGSMFVVRLHAAMPAVASTGEALSPGP